MIFVNLLNGSQMYSLSLCDAAINDIKIIPDDSVTHVYAMVG